MFSSLLCVKSYERETSTCRYTYASYNFSVLEGAINFTEDLRVAKIDDKIEPMYSPIEKEFIPLRDDQVENNATRNEILKNAVLLDEEYFVTPLNKNTDSS
nr:PREDICTED: glutamyl-tRNA(Gln) amidotransferase subunit C-2, mitochondrial [Megachile rotundata]